MSSIRIAADILRYLEGEREISVSAVSTTFGLPKSSVSRLLKEMSEAGFLARSPGTRRYGPGPLLLSAGRQYKAGLELVDRATVELEALVRRFGHSGFVSALDRANLVLIRAVPGTRAVRVSIDDRYTGGTAFYRSSGRALLARLTDDEVRALYPVAIKAPSTFSPQTIEELLGELQRIRGKGYAEGHDEEVEDVAGVSVAIGGGDQDAVALNICFATKLVDEEQRMEIAAAMLEVAQKWAETAGATD